MDIENMDVENRRINNEISDEINSENNDKQISQIIKITIVSFVISAFFIIGYLVIILPEFIISDSSRVLVGIIIMLIGLGLTAFVPKNIRIPVGFNIIMIHAITTLTVGTLLLIPSAPIGVRDVKSGIFLLVGSIGFTLLYCTLYRSP